MKLGACGHPVSVWFSPAHVVCQDCFGFEYQRNSYRELPRLSVEVEKRNQREAA